MYYISNVKKLGEKKCIIYTNMYINFLKFGCIYKDMDIINKLCPVIVKDIPESFLFCFK